MFVLSPLLFTRYPSSSPISPFTLFPFLATDRGLLTTGNNGTKQSNQIVRGFLAGFQHLLVAQRLGAQSGSAVGSRGL